jgi:hypothetical protein
MNNFEEPFDERSTSSVEFPREELDRMVDGELSEDEQWSLLQRLKESPSGWRELALAYVEASVWKEQFSTKLTNSDASVTAEIPAVIVPTTHKQIEVAPPAGRSAGRQHSTMTSVFAAVSVLLVFGLGIWLGRTQIELPTPRSQIADNQKSPRTNIANTPPLTGPSDSTTVTQSAGDSIPKTVQVVYSDGQSDVLRVVDVPIASSVPLESAQQFDEFWSQRSSAIPADLRAELEKSGHQIRESRDFWPAQLPDGRAVVIPVSQIHVASNPLAVP